MTPVFGEFRKTARAHLAAAVSFGGEPFYGMQCGVVMQLSRLTAILQRYLSDLPLPVTLDPRPGA